MRRIGEARTRRKEDLRVVLRGRSPLVREFSAVGSISKQNKDGKDVKISLYRPINSVVD
jgi:hypothetical protein